MKKFSAFWPGPFFFFLIILGVGSSRLLWAENPDPENDILETRVSENRTWDPAEDAKALALPRPVRLGWLPEPVSDLAELVDRNFYGILILAGVLFTGVQGALILFLIRYSRKERKAVYILGSKRVEILWTLIPALILIGIAVSSQKIWKEVKSVPPDSSDTIRVRIEAEQFAWNIRYPGADKNFDTADDIVKINQLHIPEKQPVRATLISVEREGKPAVIHSFFLPDFRLKQDVIPGLAIDVWFKAKRTGKYEIACAEFCGLGHYRMRGFLWIHSREGFSRWLSENAPQPLAAA